MRFGTSHVLRPGRCLAIVAVLAMCTSVSAQTYKEASMGNLDSGKIRSLKALKDGVLRGSIPLSQRGDEMKAYYTRYLFPAMTRTDQRDKLASLRNEAIVDLAKARSQEARAEAYELIKNTSNALAKNKNYHPATRYNALLLLGQLNTQEADGNRPPVPDTSVLKTLIGPLASKNEPPMLRYAAVLGLLRQAEISGNPKSPSAFNDTFRRGLVKYLLPVVLEQAPPEGVDERAHAWLRARAVEIIGHLRYTDQPDVVEPLAQLVVDNEQDINLRTAAAEALGRMASALDPKLASDLVGRVTKLIVDSSNAETQALVEVLTGGRGGRGMRREGGYAPSFGSEGRRREGGRLPELENGRRRGAITEEDIADKNTIPTRRRHLGQLLTIRRALAGDSRAGVDGLITMSGGKELVDPIIALLNQMIEDLQDVETDVRGLGGKLTKSRKALLPLIPENLGEVEEDEALDAAIEAAAEEADAEQAAEAAGDVNEGGAPPPEAPAANELPPADGELPAAESDPPPGERQR